MRGRYNGRHMTIYGVTMPGAIKIANWANKIQPLTDKAKWRLKIIDWHRSHNRNISLTARHFGLTRRTIRSWLNKFKQTGALGLNDISHRPKHLRQPITSWQTVAEAVKLRQQYPAWSKYKIKAVLEQEHIIISVSTIGRILKRKGLISKKISKKKQKAAKHPRQRFPRGFTIKKAGDMAQMDTKHIVVMGGRKFYQFTAIDVLSKQRVLRVYSSNSSRNGAHFLEECINNFDFKIRNIQTDNGAEFLKEFDKLCNRLNIPHYFIYPRHPKQNCYVESSHSADEREFYQQGNASPILEVMQRKIIEWQEVWNKKRPHGALDYLTPEAYCKKWQTGHLPTRDIITLQT